MTMDPAQMKMHGAKLDVNVENRDDEMQGGVRRAVDMDKIKSRQYFNEYSHSQLENQSSNIMTPQNQVAKAYLRRTLSSALKNKSQSVVKSNDMPCSGMSPKSPSKLKQHKASVATGSPSKAIQLPNEGSPTFRLTKCIDQ